MSTNSQWGNANPNFSIRPLQGVQWEGAICCCCLPKRPQAKPGLNAVLPRFLVNTLVGSLSQLVLSSFSTKLKAARERPVKCKMAKFAHFRAVSNCQAKCKILKGD